jgi:hypothetical protein
MNLPNEPDEKRINLTHCVWCPLAMDGVCLAYRMELDDKVLKPKWCEYAALIMGKDDRDGSANSL